MMMDYQMRGGTAHAIIIQGQRNGIVTDVVKNLADNTGGLTQTMNISNSLDDRMAEVASRIWEDHQLMADTFEIEYVSDAKALGSVELDLGRGDVKLRMSGRRPF
jgi:archaellum component FlaG (FlaF/FlaG flagellin family)